MHILPIPESDDVLELEAAGDPSDYFRRIARTRPDGSSVWSAGPPDRGPDDAWTSVRVNGNEVVARSWSGYVVTFDVATGTERGSVFTK